MSFDGVISESGDLLETDDEGRFHSPRGLPRDLRYSVKVKAPGYVAVETESIEPATWNTTTFADVVLPREPTLRTVTGRVVDSGGGALRGATVWQAGDGPRLSQTVTAEDGSFRLSDIYDWSAIVFVRADGHRMRGKQTDGPDIGEIVLYGADERPPKAQWPPNDAPAMTRAVRRGWARKLVAPVVPHLEQPTDPRTLVVCRAFGGADPKQALKTADHPNVARRNWLRQEAAAALIESDFETALQALARIDDSSMQGGAYMTAYDALPDGPSEKHQQLLEAALASARAAAGRPISLPVLAMSAIAQRWFDLAEAQPGVPQESARKAFHDRGVAIAREAQDLFELSRRPDGRSVGQGELAGALARFDAPAALALLDGFTSNQNDWYSADVARGVAAYAPLEAEIAFERMQRPNLRSHYAQGVVQRMAAADADRAAKIARALPALGQQAYGLGLVATALANVDHERAIELLHEAFAKLQQAPRERPERETNSAAVVALGLLPVVERIERDAMEDYFWQAMALRPPFSASGQMTWMQRQELASLVTLVARYDRSLARKLAQPLTWQFRKVMARLVDANTGDHVVVTALAEIDPRWAVELVESLPDFPARPIESPRHVAALYLAHELVRSDRQTRQVSYLRSLDARPSQR